MRQMDGALEAHASALRDSLIDGMSFGSRPTASYIINRRSVSFPPMSGGTFEPGVLRLLRFSLQDATDGGSSGWLDGSTMRIPHLPASMFRRCRVLVAGVEAHDIQDYGRCVEMFENLMPSSRQVNDLVEGFGSFTAAPPADPRAPQGSQATFSVPWKPMPLPGGSFRRVLLPLLAPFQSEKLLPLAR